MKVNMFFSLFASAVFSSALWADLQLDPVFSSNMVLQQDKPITFFGTADKGTNISVAFNGNTILASADEDGRWKTQFPAMKAGKNSYAVTISDGQNKLKLDDILIGEVWFCSGQSNMQMPIGKKFQRGWSVQNCEEEVANSTDPELRYAFQKLIQSHQKILAPQYQNANGWVKCSPETAHYFSATAYFFGRQLRRDLNVPVGLINSSWGGTRIEPWISPAGYQQFGPSQELAQLQRFDLNDDEKKQYVENEKTRFIREMTQWHPLFEAAGAQQKAAAAHWADADFDDSAWPEVKVESPSQYLVRWSRTKFMLTDDLKGKDVQLHMNKLGESADLYLNGKQIASWKAFDPEEKKVVRISLSTEQLKQNGENVLAIRAEHFYSTQGRSHIQNTLLGNLLADQGRIRIPLDKNWKQMDEFACSKSSTQQQSAPNFIAIPYASHQFPTNLYNSMVASWTKLPIRGVIWYQGCSNNGDPRYYLLHKTLISDWRVRWNNPEMPFLIVQLAGFEPSRANNWQTADATQVSGYALTRDIQREMLRIANVGLACAIDIGEAANIHPANKQDVGKRLALEAERIAYKKDIVSCGPLFESAKAENGRMRVFFQYADNGLKTSDGKAPGAFAIAGADKKFVWADAQIDGNTVVVSSAQIQNPQYIRYAYAGYRGDCNLQNSEGLPAYPFRSDAFDFDAVK